MQTSIYRGGRCGTGSLMRGGRCGRGDVVRVGRCGRGPEWGGPEWWGPVLQRAGVTRYPLQAQQFKVILPKEKFLRWQVGWFHEFKFPDLLPVGPCLFVDCTSRLRSLIVLLRCLPVGWSPPFCRPSSRTELHKPDELENLGKKVGK